MDDAEIATTIEGNSYAIGRLAKERIGLPIEITLEDEVWPRASSIYGSN